MTQARTLVIGYGNPGRLDDGLGPALAEALENIGLPDVTVDSDYQLTVEDAALVAQHQTVIFADAAVKGREPFFFRRLEPVSALSFSSHSLDPVNVLALAEEMFGARVAGYALGIRGYEFNEFGERLSPQAQQNLALAVSFLSSILTQGNVSEAVTPADGPKKRQLRDHGESICKTENT